MDKRHINVLLIEDNPGDARLIEFMLHESQNTHFSLICVGSLAAGKSTLDELVFDVVLLDLSLPDSHGLQTLETVLGFAPTLPVIVMTGLDDESIGLQAVNLGAQDYLVKGQVDSSLLQRAIRYAVERKYVEQALTQSEARFRSLTENSPAGIYIIQDYQFVHVNPALAGFFGYTQQDLIGMPVLDVVAPADRDLVKENMRRRLEGEVQVVHYELRGLHQDGHIFECEVLGGIVSQDGVPTILGTMLDISERKAEETQLRLLWHAVNQSANSVVITDTQGNISYVNPAFTKVTGYRLEEVLGKNPRILKSGQSPPEVYQQLWKTLTAGKEWSGEFLNKKKNGDLYWEQTNISPMRDPDGQITHFIAIKEDITEQKKAQTALEDERVFLRTLVDNIPDHIYAKDSAARFTLSNKANNDLVGASSPDDLMGKTDLDVHPESVAVQYLADDRYVIETGESLHNKEEQAIDADGQSIWMQTTKIPLRDARGEVTGLIGIGHDITELKRNEQALREAERFARSTVDALTAHIAIIDETGTILAVNDAWRRFGSANGGDPTQCGEGANYLEVLKAVDPMSADAQTAQAVLDGINQVISGETDTYSLEYPCHAPDEQRWFTVRVSRFAGDGPVRIVVTHENITVRKLAEEAAQEQRALAETLRETITILTSTLETDRVMQHILDNIGRLVPHTSANIMLVEGDIATISHCRGYGEQAESELKKIRFPLSMGTFSRMLSSGQPVRVDDVTIDANWHTVSLQLPIRSYLGAPIQIKGQVIGFINLENSELSPFSDQQVERLQIFSEQAAIAIQNAQMYDGMSRSAAELAKIQRATELLITPYSRSQTLDDVGIEVAEAAVTTFGLVDAGIILVDDGLNSLVRLKRPSTSDGQSLPVLDIDGHGLVPRAIRTQQTVYCPDVAKEPHYIPTYADTRSELVIPLFSGDQVMGALDIQSPKLHPFDAYDLRTFQAFAQNAAVKLSNVKLFTSVKDYALNLAQRVGERTHELQRMNDRLTAILNNANDGIILLDSDYTIQNTNLSFDAMFGCEHDQWFGQSIRILTDVESQDRLLRALETTVATQSPLRITLPLQDIKGQPFDADVAVAYVRGNTGHVVCSIRDITHLKEIERVKDQFVSMVSHELRTPISSIMLSSSTINKHYDRLSDDQKRKKLQQITQQAQALTDLVTAILDVSRLDQRQDQHRDEMVDMSKALDDAIVELNEQAKTNNHTIQVHRSDDQLVVQGEHSDMVRIWRNFLSNAIKYTDNGGQINITLCRPDKDDLLSSQESELSGFRDHFPEDIVSTPYIVGIVTDNGHGIDEDDINNLFTRFYRGWATATSITGTGLGLSLVRDLLQLYGGDVAVASELGVGTTFCFWLPVYNKEGKKQ